MAKKKLPKTLALLDEDMCTGCEACMCVCPVDCISVVPGPRHELSFQVCTIDLPRCIGCTLCAQACPTAAITYTPYEKHSIDERLCTRCDMCRQACQDDAVEVLS